VGGYAVPPIPSERPALDTYIKRHRLTLPSEQRDHPDWAANTVLWRPMFQQERQDAIDQFDENIYNYYFFKMEEHLSL
jgi:cyclopropane fatty-acyl-phospholipid synthase-like methyltransferase